MPGNVHELRPRAGDAEKITINLGYVDLGHIDLLVQEGSTPTALTSSAPPFATRSSGTRKPPSSQSREKASNWACAITAGTIWKPRRLLGRL